MLRLSDGIAILVLSLVLMLAGLACAPKVVGPTDSSGYFFSVRTPTAVTQGERMPIIVQVQDAQGNPVDGVPVEFAVGSGWNGNASIVPARVVTSNGRARAVFWAGLIGVVPVTVRVDNTTEELRFSSSPRGEKPGGA